MSRLRARCPDCHTFTAVALGPGYECHACGREFGAGLVRVPRAWGDGGETMAEAARLPITEYAPDSGACLDYRQFADELIERHDELSEPSPRRVSRWRRLFTRSSHNVALDRRAV